MSIEPTLRPFFDPAGIAIIGASSAPAKLGFGVARNLTQSGYTGAIHFVNPRGGHLLERPVYTAIAAVPDPVDLAVVIVPAPAVAAALAEVGRRGIRAAIIVSGGFRETGPDGARLEDDCLRVARDYDMRLIGPNCVGLLDTHRPLDTTFLPPPGPTPGDVAFISHSGAICAAVIDWARGQGFGLSQLVSLGNQIDVRETDMLTSVAADRHTRVITLYLEGISDGRRFVHCARQVTRHKPIIALKVGRFAAGQRAVASHTGALAGQESAFNAAFRRAGVIRANTSEELFDWARALAWCPLPVGRDVAVLTNAGGPGVTAADALESHGLRLATLRPETDAALRALLPPDAGFANPVDMLAAATSAQYAEALRLLLDDPGVHSVMVVVPPPPMESAGGIARALIPIITTAAKPVVIALMGERMIQEAVEYFRAARVPEYRFPERAAAALAVLVERAESARALAADDEAAAPLARIDPDRVHRLLARCAPGFLPLEVVNEVLAAYGIRVPRAALATTADEAVDLAWQIGFPVALKVASPDIVHKSEAGGVRLNLQDPDGVRHAFEEVLAAGRAATPGATIHGVTVQQMILIGQEVIVGAVQDAQFGPLVMFGSGGVEVEGLRDVEFALAPVTPGEAEGLLARTWAGRRLGGFRNMPPADRAAVLAVIRRLGQLAADFPQLAEIELNPVRVLPGEGGAVAVDARARLGNRD
ncbi:MAG: acetate--CoA ligase family protein [Anaerolineae bacterium]|nr:acetate--CoA ligase family protein [Anaerolineae bacterium]